MDPRARARARDDRSGIARPCPRCGVAGTIAVSRAHDHRDVGARLDLLRHALGFPRARRPRSARAAGARARALPHRERVRTIRHDDARAIRDRIPGERRWREVVDRVSLSLQAAGCERASWDLRAVPAALRLESLVRVAGAVAGLAVGGLDAGATREGER